MNISRCKEAAAAVDADAIGTERHRPWGSYTVLAVDPKFKLKRIVVQPGARLSLQRHRHRREHWYVLAGSAEVELDGTRSTLNAGQAIDIPLHAWHRLENATPSPLELIEVQCGAYFGEDDIERAADDYGRVGEGPAPTANF